MLKTIRNAFRVPDLRKKLLFTLMIIVVFRIGSVIPVPFLDMEALRQAMSNLTSAESGSMFAYLDTLSGGAFSLSRYLVGRCFFQCNTVRNGCYALHQQFDYNSAADRSNSRTRASFKRGRGGKKEACYHYKICNRRSRTYTGYSIFLVPEAEPCS